MRDFRLIGTDSCACVRVKFVQAAANYQAAGIFQGVENLCATAFVHQEADVAQDRKVVEP